MARQGRGGLHALLAAAVALLLARPAAAADTVAFASGELVLHGLLYKPAGPGPFPAVLYDHGSAPGLSSNEAFDRIAPVFVAHGWAFFAPYRRGQGLSGDAGPYLLDEVQSARDRGGLPLAAQTLVRLLRTEQLQDSQAALTWLGQQPFVRSDAIAAMGNSFGGIVALFGAEQGDYCAVVDAAGGAESWKLAPALRDAMLDAARRSRAPILLLQADNDFTTAPSRALYAALQAAHKPAQIRIFPPYGHTPDEGHRFAYEGVAVWQKAVLAFLRTHCER